MEYIVTNEWNEALWQQAKPIYMEAFGAHGAKSEPIVRGLFAKGIGSLHVLKHEGRPIAMALAGKLEQQRVLILDYLAVDGNHRGKGYGQALVHDMRDWASSLCDRIIIEAEAEQTKENLRRIHFWEKCGFTLTEYVHTYIWVPEPYQAMYLDVASELPSPGDGRSLFRSITQFHGIAYRGQGSKA
ncbi:GNAT family N-acetyltransferase [Ectobacillus ponti]|uniref:GNAT family N-acetyltransferase n=1 Tax=Ectobacillus ponti TaxID=2961894 RepID=A0AA41XB00_9BACI|nr:GNAT family N-acetyltransferase [Ectobacillus ponti]MCP8970383.1 GNAT family N-acetyltransferase [Ectobacillus ponti]